MRLRLRQKVCEFVLQPCRNRRWLQAVMCFSLGDQHTPASDGLHEPAARFIASWSASFGAALWYEPREGLLPPVIGLRSGCPALSRPKKLAFLPIDLRL